MAIEISFTRKETEVHKFKQPYLQAVKKEKPLRQ